MLFLPLVIKRKVLPGHASSSDITGNLPLLNAFFTLMQWETKILSRGCFRQLGSLYRQENRMTSSPFEPTVELSSNVGDGRIRRQTACARSARAPLRKTSVNGSAKVPGWENCETSVMAYLPMESAPTIRHLISSSLRPIVEN
jgi:hypothetical protein